MTNTTLPVEPEYEYAECDSEPLADEVLGDIAMLLTVIANKLDTIILQNERMIKLHKDHSMISDLTMM